MKRKAWIICLGAIAIALLVGGVAWAAETAQPANRLRELVVRGTVTDVEGDRVTLETHDGDELSLLITERTQVWVPGEPPTKDHALAEGDPVLAFGQPTTDDAGSKMLSAWLVVVASDEELPRVLIRGRAIAVTRQTIVVQTGARERAITVLPRTRFWSPRGRISSLRDVHVGDAIIALGQPTELGQWHAGLVIALGPELQVQRGLRGQVTAVDVEADTLTVQTEGRGEIVVAISSETRFRIPGIEEPELADIEPGDRVAVTGRLDDELPDRFIARVVTVIVAPGEEGRSTEG